MRGRLCELISRDVTESEPSAVAGGLIDGVRHTNIRDQPPAIAGGTDMDIRTAADLMGATTDSLRPELFDKEILDFSIDSRTTEAAELFFALSQPDYERAGFNGQFADAHNFIGSAFERGAIAAVARKERVAADDKLKALSDRLLLVDDAIAALQMLARKVYEQWA